MHICNVYTHSQLKSAISVMETHNAVTGDIDADPTYSTIHDLHSPNDQQRYISIKNLGVCQSGCHVYDTVKDTLSVYLCVNLACSFA